MGTHARVARFVLLGLQAIAPPAAGADTGDGPASVVRDDTWSAGPPAGEAVTPDSVPNPPTPVLSVRVIAPASVTAGKPIEYRICVDNLSPAPAHHVVLRNPLPAGTRLIRASPEPAVRQPELEWRLGTVGPGVCREIVLVVAPGGQSEEVRSCARVQFEHGQCVCTKVLRPSLRVRKEGPDRAVLYDSVGFRLEVMNTGTADANDVTLADVLPAGLEPVGKAGPWKLGTIPPGERRTVEYQVVAKAPGRICNRAVATAGGGLRAEAESCLVVSEPKLSVTKSGPERRYLTAPAAYRVTVTNAGTAVASNVVISDPLPPRTEFVSASAGGRLVGREVQWPAADIGPGESRTVELALRVREAGRVRNRVFARGDRGLSAQAEFDTEFVGAAALLLEVVDTEDPVEVGSETSYVILVRNQGDVPATGVRIVATVPSQLQVVRVTAPADQRLEGRVLTFQPLTLAPHTDVRCVVHARALRPGDVRFKVDLSADQLTSGPVHEEESTTLYADVADGPAARPGSRNKGTVPAR